MIKKNIVYAEGSRMKHLLDVTYDPEKKGLPVLFFIHGGSWMSGSKDMYTKLGLNFVSKGFVSTVISYRLFPETDVYGMVDDCRAAFKWCKENINEYGGNASKIYLAGHSAGGHLVAVTGLLEKEPRESIAGFIMIDAFGLSAYHFLTSHSTFIPESFVGVFGKKKDQWPLVSPDMLLKKELPSFLVLTGGETYPFIEYDNQNFIGLLKDNGIGCTHRIIPSKSHMQMIWQFENPNAKIYKELLDWMSVAD